LSFRMEVQSKKLEKFLNTLMWFHRKIFITHSPGTSDEFNWRNPIWWQKIVELENWSWQSPDIKRDEVPPADLTDRHDVRSHASHDIFMFKHKSNIATAITVLHYIQDHWASGLWPLSSIQNTMVWKIHLFGIQDHCDSLETE
jgi:hypothetical protein